MEKNPEKIENEKTLKIFNKKYKCNQHLKISIKDIYKTKLKSQFKQLFDTFKTLCEDHPTPENTIIYLLKRNCQIDLLWTCSHFEATTPIEITGLAYFLQELEETITNSATIDLLDGINEKLIICAYNIPTRIWKNLHKIAQPNPSTKPFFPPKTSLQTPIFRK